jgi:choline-sulfatase
VRLVPASIAALAAACTLAASCSRYSGTPAVGADIARNLLIVTIDTLRADRVGAYGYARARTPSLDGIAARGVRFDRAFATAPITLPSHASLMTGRYPPSHGGRHNGIRVNEVPTLAGRLEAAGFATGAFVGAFPLDHRFGLDKGFQAYGDRMPRGPEGRPANERTGREVVDDALAWLAEHRAQRFFLWVHLFEPHAPYGDPGDKRPVEARYDDEVAEADRQVGRLVGSLGPDAASTLTVVASDHGEAFGEHGEIGHSIFVYDTTLRVPLILAGPSIEAGTVGADVSLADVAPTVATLLGVGTFDADGLDLGAVLRGATPAPRELYAESFAPLLDFGWSALRSVRADGLKYIAAPSPELYDTRTDPAESRNLVTESAQRTASLVARVDGISSAELEPSVAVDSEAAGRLQALGYTSGRPQNASQRADPKDRRDLVARLAQVTSGELSGPALESTLRRILESDPQNPQAHLRLGYVLADSNRCAEAEPHFRSAIAARTPTADAHLGLAGCLAGARKFDKAADALRDGLALEPDNPVVVANQGVVLSDAGKPLSAIPLLQRAVALDPEFHQARFNLALAFARTGQAANAAAEAQELLRRLPPDAPQRPEVRRLLAAVQ